MPISISKIGSKTYWIFFAFNASFVPVMVRPFLQSWASRNGIANLLLLFDRPQYYFYPETSGKTLEEVDALFAQMRPGQDFKHSPHTFEQDKSEHYHVEHVKDKGVASA
jgi:hypothetical protein